MASGRKRASPTGKSNNTAIMLYVGIPMAIAVFGLLLAAVAAALG